MEVKYIIESVYANGDKYADKLDTLYEAAQALKDIEFLDNDGTPDDERIDSRQVALTTEEQ